MKRNAYFTCLLFSLLAMALPAMAQTESDQSPNRGVVVSKTATLEATVQDIDYKNRLVTLKGPQGNTVRVKVGEDRPNFNQLKKGDRVRVQYYESTALSLQKPGEEAMSGAGQQVYVEPGQGRERGPSRVMVNTSQITATVQDIDHQNRTVTLKGPEGNTVELQVDQRVKNFDQLKKGDQVVATFTDAVGISVLPKQ